MVVNNEIIYVYVFASARPVDGVSGIVLLLSVHLYVCTYLHGYIRAYDMYKHICVWTEAFISWLAVDL